MKIFNLVDVFISKVWKKDKASVGLQWWKQKNTDAENNQRKSLSANIIYYNKEKWEDILAIFYVIQSLSTYQGHFILPW